jgi:hypothetical protein
MAVVPKWLGFKRRQNTGEQVVPAVYSLKPETMKHVRGKPAMG